MKKLLGLFLVLIMFSSIAIAPAVSVPAAMGISRIWAVDSSEKIMRNDLSNPLATDPNNKVWNGNNIAIFGGKNEIVSFQLILQTGAAQVDSVNVTLPSLQSGSYSIDNTKAPSLSDPYNYIGKHIELFVESYLNIDVRTGKCNVEAWGYSGIQGNYLGWVPDALVPFQAAPGAVGTPGGAPFSIEANANQGVWVDIYIPKDAPSGIYNGTVGVTINSTSIAQIPISLEVYNFTIPDETHLNNYFWFAGYETNLINRFNVTYGSAAYYPIESNFMKLFHRNRMNLLTNVNYKQMTTGTIPYMKYIIDGANSWFTPQNGYEGPGEAVGNHSYILGKYNSWRAGFPESAGASYCNACGGNIPPADGVCNTPAWWQKQAVCWVNWFKTNAPTANYTLQISPDEAVPAEYSAETNLFIQHMDWLDGTGLPRYVSLIGFPLGSPKTTDNPYPPTYPYLSSNIEYWGVGTMVYYHPPASYWGGTFGKYDGFIKSYVDYQHSLGKKVFMYNGTLPWSGSALIDADATNFRVIPWVALKYNVDAYSYYHVSSYAQIDTTTGQTVSTNPFVNNYHLHSSSSSKPACIADGYKPEWGSGSLVYPGTNFNPTTHVSMYGNLNLPGPVASIRMKNWLRGEQDYEYLYLAKLAGHQTEATNIINAIVPKALYDMGYSSTGWPDIPQPTSTWPTRGYVFENARRQLANLLAPQPSITPTPTATKTLTPTPISTSTSTLTPTSTSTNTPIPTATKTNTPTSTLTSTSIPTLIPTSTSTPTLTLTPTSINTSTPTQTLVPTVTNTYLPIITATKIPMPTSTPTPTPHKCNHHFLWWCLDKFFP